MKELEEVELLRLKRGLGLIYILAGASHAWLMAFATLYSLGRVKLVIPASLWSEMYYAHFLFLCLAGGLYLFLCFRKTRTFNFEATVDYSVGVAVFILLLTFTGAALYKGWVNPWFSLAPSVFLLAYGLGLRAGKRFGFLPAPPP